MRIRLRFSNDKVSTFNQPDPTVNDLLDEIRKETGTHNFEIKTGYPPAPILLTSIPGDFKLNQLELDPPQKLDGSQLIINISAPEERQFTPPPPQASKPSIPTNAPKDKDDPPSVYIPNRGEVVLRVMPDDNSCLFNAVNFTVLAGGSDAQELRGIIAFTIQENKETYSEAVLEQKPDEYCSWINMPSSWGGGIELGILSKQFDVEIAALDVQTGSVLQFNENPITKKRVILVYSGIHYDAIALSPGLGYGQDVVMFDINDDGVLQGAIELVGELRKRAYFTDTKNFTLRCEDCGIGLKGESAAKAHGKATGHRNFGEYTGEQ